MKSSRDYPDRPILCASAAVFRDGLVLLGSRRNPPYDPVFSLPGGLVETGESLEEAALREVEEETGVRPRMRFRVARPEPALPISLPHRHPLKVDCHHAADWTSGRPELNQ